jgi:acetyl esterase/lipase
MRELEAGIARCPLLRIRRENSFVDERILVNHCPMNRARFALGLTLLVGPFAPNAARADDDVQSARITYSRPQGRALPLLLLRPRQLPKRALPIVIYFHGGAWNGGSFERVPPVAHQLAKRGFAVASLEFRQSSEAPFPAPLDDGRAAIRFLKTSARNYSLDSRRIGVYGVSTGGHLAALLALTGSSVRAAAIQSAPSDLGSLREGSRFDWNSQESPLTRFLGGRLAQKRELARRASPLFFVDELAPPFLILHGDADDFVPPAQSERLFNALKKAGAPVVYRLYQGEDHGFGEARVQADREIIAFLRRTL